MTEILHDTQLISILIWCLLIFGIAGLVVPIFNKIHISPVLGFLICGVAISPHTASLFDDSMPFVGSDAIADEKTVALLGELGVIALLFMIGLELSFEKLREMKRYIFGLGSMQIIVTGAFIFVIALLFGNSLEASMVIGAAFSLSSTAIIMQLLKDHNLTRRSLGRTSFSILLMQDLAIVPILILIGTFSNTQNGANSLLLLVISLGSAALCILGIYVMGKKLIQPALYSIAGTKKDEWLVAFTLFVLCAATLITLKMGVSAALGALLAGLLIAETEFRDKIEKILYPLKSILLGIFFISIGMMVNIGSVLENPFWLGLSVLGIFMVKGVVLYPLSRIFGIKDGYAREIALVLSQPGEFTLMIISLSMTMGLLPHNDGQFFLLVAVLGMLLTPIFFRFLPSAKNNDADD